MIKFTANIDQFINKKDLQEKTKKGTELFSKISSDPMGGWFDLPLNYDREEFDRIKKAAQKITSDSKFLICIGIGGSYLGHKAVIEALGATSKTKILYAGNSLSPIELNKVIDELGDADFSVNIISKSGTTTEPAIAFRIFKQKLIEKYGEAEAYKRIYATTDKEKGALHDEAMANSYEMFVVPDDIGGRYSVLTAVGLLPIAVSGIDIHELMLGADVEREELIASEGGDAVKYAATRNTLYKDEYYIEILANFEPSFMYFNEWWKQLAGESEGKENKGIFPASVIDTTDLHSMGQYIQEGRRNLIETVVKFTTLPNDYEVPALGEDVDGLGYLEGKELSYVNQKAIEATIMAHTSGGVPVLELEVSDVSARSLGAMIYFFEVVIAVSGYLLEIDPFNQPGVEAYKTNMFHLLGKPGY